MPPCPRCGFLTDFIGEKVELLGLDVEMSHIAYTSQEAKQIAAKIGLEPGTAKDVAKKVGEEIDLSALPHQHKSDVDETDLEPGLQQFAKEYIKSRILDNRLRQYENMAQKVGILMTPALIINDNIKHQGSVPDLDQLDIWLKELAK